MSRLIYWTILVAGGPTAFRARNAEDLLPTLKQLQRRQPDAVLKWFEGGRIWNSPEEAQAERVRARREARTRGRDWRPGGTHSDPRARPKIPRAIKRRTLARRFGWKKANETDDAGGAAPRPPRGHFQGGPRVRRPRESPGSKKGPKRR
ncbi:MAG: hypothetical protein GEV06_12230 [Luteitalea sp.]|nr:hypothetical protein [Luteitalea sp.]